MVTITSLTSSVVAIVIEVDVMVAAAGALVVLAVAAAEIYPLKFQVQHKGGHPPHGLLIAVRAEEDDLSSKPLYITCPGECICGLRKSALRNRKMEKVVVSCLRNDQKK